MGLLVLEEFRKTLSDIMLKAMHKRVLLYGFGYTGRFLKWYAEYYHGIKVDYIVSLDMPFSMGYEQEVFTSSVFEFDYSQIKEAIVWVAEPLSDSTQALLEKNGYKKNETYFDFYEQIYGDDVLSEIVETDVCHKRKSGKRDIQFLEYLEWKYNCNFVTAVERKDLITAGNTGHAYKVTTQKEIFEVLDRCHIVPGAKDAIFDFGCGKGGAIVSFLDYGFNFAGGVEFEPGLCDVLKTNIKNLGLENQTMCLEGDATLVKKELDRFNWFYFFAPFVPRVFGECLDRICESISRVPRKVGIIYLNPDVDSVVKKNSVFRLTNEFTISTRNRVVKIYENI